MLTANELIGFSEKIELTMDCPNIDNFLYKQLGCDYRMASFYTELKDYLESVMVCETRIHPNGYAYYRWLDRDLETTT